MVSEIRLASQYANQVARAIVRLDDRLSIYFFLMPHDLPTIPLRSTYWARLDSSIMSSEMASVMSSVMCSVCIYMQGSHGLSESRVLNCF